MVINKSQLPKVFQKLDCALLKKRTFSLVLFYTLMALILFSFTACKKIEETPYPVFDSTKDFPALEVRDSVVLDLWDGSNLSWILRTQYLRKMTLKNEFTARPIDILLFDTTGKKSGTVVADSGRADEKATYLHVWGNVFLKATNGAEVKADSLRWDKQRQEIRTEGKVRVVSEDGDILTGVGFISDDRLERWKILNNVRSVITRVEERAE